MYGGELSLEEWNTRLDTLKHEIENVCTEDEMRAFLVASEEQSKEEQLDEMQNKDVEMEEAVEDKEKQTEEQRADVEEITPVTNITTEIQSVNMAPKKTVVSAEKLQQLVMMRAFHADAVQFIELIHKAIPIITQLLSSKSKAEVLESMDFLVVAYNYKVKIANDGIKKMLHLIWTKDTSDEGKGIKMKLISCYENLYLEMDSKLSKKENVNRVAKNLIQLTYNTNLAELTSLEQLMSTLMAENKITRDVIQKLWSVYGFTQGRIQKSQRRGAIIILSMLAKAKTEVVSDKIDVMLKIGLGPLGKADMDLARYTCIALQRLEGAKPKEKTRGVQEGIRFPLNYPIFTRLKDIIETPTNNQLWFSFAEQAINTIFLLCKNPETLCEEIIRNKTNKVFGDKEISVSPTPSTEASTQNDTSTIMEFDLSMTQQALPFPQHPIYQDPLELSQLFFLVGHVALKEIVHLEIVEAAWKRKKSMKESKKQDGEQNTSVDDELDQVGGTAEDDIGEAITKIREREILFGPHSLLGIYGPLITEVCARNKIYTDRTLQLNATLALSKFMCSKDPNIRSNIVIALGDMAVCFSTLIDDNITFLYNRLSDPNTLVRKNAVMVLTHLILNGMVKVKGQLSEMAKCLEDKDQRIADLAKLFFTELASKDNAIYNNLPDIISSLTNNQPNRLEEDSFRKIMKFIFSFDFTEKEKQAENIVDKLCQRFLTAEDERSWRDIAYCLSLLPFKSEKTFKKLLEGWPTYQDKIHEDAVHKSFLEIIQKGRFHKNQKPELKAIVDEFEQKIEKQRGPDADKNEAVVKKGKVSKPKEKKKKEESKTTSASKKQVRKRKRYIEEDSEEEEEEMDFDEEDEDDEDDEEDEDEDEDEEEEEDEEEYQEEVAEEENQIEDKGEKKIVEEEDE
ncbi:non-SMC mitotic condensation complex subunit 1-domain-containing protein [Cokeromyces recurvatus]|uniref:non-SMC mitotic condensation complex subunit 1-domain-containing protein n=1 Tax=Cokeromyces recurvatus TaxID=90255 RepID=UPI002220BEE7|nr:non-SMC mitotic condensation complex subunit 1-domain-containing protein [Cokeromyces recurvatus]KAI7899931.1 non-SMC mitotic condensation complex subunit 1-domain-containing protein [Cokeromyces recurvatus]